MPQREPERPSVEAAPYLPLDDPASAHGLCLAAVLALLCWLAVLLILRAH